MSWIIAAVNWCRHNIKFRHIASCSSDQASRRYCDTRGFRFLNSYFSIATVCHCAELSPWTRPSGLYFSGGHALDQNIGTSKKEYYFQNSFLNLWLAFWILNWKRNMRTLWFATCFYFIQFVTSFQIVIQIWNNNILKRILILTGLICRFCCPQRGWVLQMPHTNLRYLANEAFQSSGAWSSTLIPHFLYQH